MQGNYKVIDMPMVLSRNVKTQSQNNNNIWIRDESWYQQMREIYRNLFHFFDSEHLLKEGVNLIFSDDLVLNLSHLNDNGKALIRSGADEKWLNAFDKPRGAPVPTDLSILKRALQKIQSIEPKA